MEFLPARMIRPTSFMSSLPQASAPTRPLDSPVSEPEESLQISGEVPRPKGRADSATAVGATLAAAGGPVMLPLAQRLGELPVTWVLERKWRLPFMARTTEITAEKAAHHTDDGRLKVKLKPDQNPVPVQGAEQVQALEALHGKGQAPGLAGQLKALQEQGLRFTCDGFPIEGYLAYQLAGQGKAVEVRQGELLLGFCEREGPRPEIEQALARAEQLKSDPLLALKHCSGLFPKDNRRVSQELQRLEAPSFKALAVAFENTGGSTPEERIARMTSVSERVKSGELAHRLAFLGRIQHLGSSTRSERLQNAACKAYDALVEKGCPPDEARELVGSVRDIALQAYDRTPVDGLEQLATLAGQPVEHLALYRQHVDRMEAPQLAKYVQFLAEPLGQSTFAERSQAFEPLRRSGTTAWDAARLAVERNGSTPEAFQGLGQLLGALKDRQEPRDACDAWTAHPDRLQDLCRLLQSGAPGQHVGQLVALTSSDCGLQLLEKLGSRASARNGLAFLEAIERHGEQELPALKSLIEAAPTRPEADLAALGAYARDHLGGRPTSSEVMGALLKRRIPVSEAGEVLEALEGWSCELPLSQRLKAFVDVCEASRYYDESGDVAGARAPLARALGALVSHGASPEEAVADLGRLWRSPNREWTAGLELVSQRLGPDRAGCKLVLDLLGQRQDLAAATRALDRLDQPIGTTTREERLQAFRDLGLEGASPAHSSALMASLRREVDAGTSFAEAVIFFKTLPRGSGEAAEFLGRHAGDRAAQELLVGLLQDGLAEKPAVTAVDRLAGKNGLAGARSALAGLGKARELPLPAVELLAGAIEDGSSEKLASLSHLSQRMGRTGRLTQTAAELFAARAVGDPALGEVLAGLLEARVQERDLNDLFEAVARPAGSTTPAERLASFQAAGGLEREDPQGYSYTRGFSGKLQLGLYETLAAQLRAGVPLLEAGEVTKRLAGVQSSDYGAIYEDFATRVADRPAEERKLFLDLTDGRVDKGVLFSLWDLARLPLGATSLTERVGALSELRRLSNSQEVQRAMLTMLRAEVEQGRDLAGSVALVKALHESAKWSAGDQIVHAFDFAASLSAQPEAREAFQDQLRHRVLPKVASQSLERAREQGDLAQLEALRGLGRAGSKLTPQVAEHLHRALEQKLRGGADRTLAMATLGRLAETAGGKGLPLAEVETATAHWSAELCESSASCEVFCKLLEQPIIGAAEAVSLEQALRPGPGEQAARLACLEQLQAFETEYSYYDDRRRPMLEPAGRQSLVSALQALLKEGVPAEQAVKELADSRSGLKREAQILAWGSLARLADQPRPREVYRELLAQHKDPELCDRILERLQLHGLEERLQAYTDLGLLKQHEPSVKERGLDVLQGEVQAGRPLAEATAELGSLLGVIRSLGEANKLAVLGEYPGLDGERRQSLQSLLKAGLPTGVVLQSLKVFGPGHEPALLALAGYGRDLSPAVAERLQASVNVQGSESADRLVGVAGGLAARKASLEVVQEALDYSDSGPAGRSGLFGQALALGAPPAEAGQLAEQLLKVGGSANAEQRLEALKVTGALGSWGKTTLECALGLNRVLVSQLLLGCGLESSTAVLRQVVSSLRLPASSGVNQELLTRLERESDKLTAWLPLAEGSGHSQGFLKVMERLHGAPATLLRRYQKVREGGCRPEEAVEILATINEPIGRSKREERIAALDRLLEVNEQDQRSWLRKTMSNMMGRTEVSSHQCLSSLVRIYRKLTEFGRMPAEAAETVAGIYSAEQSKGVTREALHKRLEELEEVARMDIRPDNNATVLLDKDGKIMFSGVTLKKRQPRPTP